MVGSLLWLAFVMHYINNFTCLELLRRMYTPYIEDLIPEFRNYVTS